MKTAVVHSRIEPGIKESAEGILHRLGLSPTEAIRIFYTEITLCDGLPFDTGGEARKEGSAEVSDDFPEEGDLERFDSVERMFERWVL